MGLFGESDYKIGWFPCAAHNMQLCINAAINGCNRVEEVLDKCQELSTFFRNNGLAKTRLMSSQGCAPGKALVPLTICQTRWNSKYLVASRVSTLLPAMVSVEGTFRDPLASPEEKRLLRKMPNMLTDEDVALLQAATEIMEIAKKFSDRVSADSSVFISQLYPTIWDIKATMATKYTDDPSVRDFQDMFVSELEKRWALNEIPEGVLIATFLNPALSCHGFFNEEIEQEGLREHVKSKVLEKLQAIAKNNPNIEELSWHFKRQIANYSEEIYDMTDSYKSFRDNPNVWWKNRKTMYPHLAMLARVYFSIQSSSAASERLFSSAGNILTKRRQTLSEHVLSRLVIIKETKKFLYIDNEQEEPEYEEEPGYEEDGLDEFWERDEELL